MLRSAEPLTMQMDHKIGIERETSHALHQLLVYVVSLYLKTTSTRWHTSHPNFREYYRLLDAQSDALFEMSEWLTKRSCTSADAHYIQKILHDDSDPNDSLERLAELREGNLQLVLHLRDTRALFHGYEDTNFADQLASWLDQTEQRYWILFEMTRTH